MDFTTCTTARLEHLWQVSWRTSPDILSVHIQISLSVYFDFFDGCDNWQEVMPPPAVPHPVLIPKVSLAPRFASKRSLACIGTPLLSQPIASVPAPAAPNWQAGTKQSSQSWPKEEKITGLGVSKQHHGLVNPLASLLRVCSSLARGATWRWKTQAGVYTKYVHD